MNYFRVEVECARRGEWYGFVQETHCTVTAASRSALEAAVRSHIEETLGEHRFEVIWLG